MQNKTFYFLRHAQTEHNVHHIYDDLAIVPINETGHSQALVMQKLLVDYPITTVCSSPLLRVQQTKKIVLDKKGYNDIVLDDLRECSGALWRLFLEAETKTLSLTDNALVQEFLQRIDASLHKALKQEGPVLIIAHGGTYWALAQLLKLKGNPKIDNCLLVQITQDKDLTWTSSIIN